MDYPPPFAWFQVDFDNEDDPSIIVETLCDIHHLTIAEARTAAECLEALADMAEAHLATMGYSAE